MPLETEAPYGLEVVTAAAALLRPEDVRAWVRNLDLDEEALLVDAIDDATNLIEDYCNRQLMPATLRLLLDAWPCDGVIRLPKHPVRSISSVKYLDTAAGTLTTLDAAAYEVDLARGRIVPAYGTSWPSARSTVNAVRVEFACGYATALGVANVPGIFKQACRAIVADAIENRRMVYELPNGVRMRLQSKIHWGS